MATVQTKNYYELLGVSDAATDDEIRKAYRKLAHQYHPDKTGGDAVAEEKLKEINEAYDVLKNKEKRAKYDEQRKYGAGFGGFEGFDPSAFGGAGGFADIFGAAFSGGPRSRAQVKRRGRDLEASVRISLRDVADGTSKRIALRRLEHCGACNGSGGKPGSSPVSCTECSGAGVISQGNGFFSVNRTCPACLGQGARYAEACASCTGTGRQTVTRDIQVTIPKGINDGARLRVAGEGEPGDTGAARGDLYVRIDIEPDPFFTRDGRHLTCDVPVTFVEAALGATLRVPTLKGLADLSIKPGTQSGAQLRMGGLGLPSMNEPKGDQIVRIVVEVPHKLTSEQKQLLREFDGNYEPEAHPLKKAFLAFLDRFRH